MSFFNGFDMADFDAYDAGYSYRPRSSSRKRYNGYSQPFDPMKTKKGIREASIRWNIEHGVWFTGAKIADMTDEHLANALMLSKRRGYEQYVKALADEIKCRKEAKE